jgi:hypothetical protein
VAQLDEVMAPGYLEGLSEWPIERVRACRNEATEAEVGLSYLRRIVQGRLDIVLADQERRRLGESAGDLDQLVERLPEILGDRVHAPGLGRLPVLMGPGELDAELSAAVEAVLPASRLASLVEFDDADLVEAATGLRELEHSLSAQRRAVFDVIDRLQEELVRRYQTGEATVDSLLP